MYILISLTLLSILCILYSHIIDYEYITGSYTFFIGTILVGWLLIGCLNPIKSKNKINRIEKFSNYKIKKLHNSYIFEDKNMYDREVKIEDSIKGLDTSKLKILIIDKYNMYDYKIDSAITLIKK